MKTLIVDDERLAREELRGLLSEFPSIQLCGEAANAREAIALVARERPQLMFLDIEMPGQDGFELLEALPPPHPRVIFVTAYDAFALRAFEVNALDYLMKPVHAKRLAAALTRVSLAPGLSPAAEPEEPAVALREDDRVFVREGERCWFVPVRALVLLESEGNHTRVHLGTAKPLLYRTLGTMEARLPPRLFLRANRAQLVNLACIEHVTPWFSGSLKVTLHGGMEIEFSRRQAQLFRERMAL